MKYPYVTTREIERIGVIGAGAWGTTLANALARKGHDVALWVREEEVHRQILSQRMNRSFLDGIDLSPGLKPVRIFEEAVSGRELVLMAVPSHVFREVLQGVRLHLHPGATVLSLAKGIENDTLMTMSQVAETLLTGKSRPQFAALGGPSFAREVSLRRPTVVTIACADLSRAQELQVLFADDFFRVYTTDDLIGVELCGALKNVFAIAAGISDGLDLGTNTRAALITRGLAEMTRLGISLGARPATFAGLAGMGDLVLTCTGDLSRNRTVGLQIGRGMRLEQIVKGVNTVAEGVRTTLSARNLALKTGVQMPIVEQVYRVLYEGKDPREGMRDLMTRVLRAEPEY
ncbi:MAG: NAD(P)-dependent glycerol-3-phosphate dehydrogenase [Desulfobacteraceae bacterium]|nr:MAG: NAD(P)-dependent glycerol-3-phosphate dehydrogenase [Desulfobacteraceae bacterium]